MARIELKYCTVRMMDGLNGTGLVNQPITPPAPGDTTLALDGVALNSLTPARVPVGATFTVAGETNPPVVPPDSLDNTYFQVHTVTGRTQGANAGVDAKQNVTVSGCTTTFTLTWGGKTTAAIAHDADNVAVKAAIVAMDDGYGTNDWDVTGSAGGPYVVEFKGVLGNAPRALMTGAGDTGTVAVTNNTTGAVPTPTTTTLSVTFTPPLGPGTYLDDAVLTFGPQQIAIKIGDGNLTYTEHRDYQYLLDRGRLDTVREPKDVPMDVKLDAVYEHIVSITGEHVCPMEALKGTGAASEWVSSSPDQCEPFCIDLEVDYEPPCAPSQAEVTLFPMFRAETREINYSAATIVLSGKCKVREPEVTRPNA
jgi:hypothetical protein